MSDIVKDGTPIEKDAQKSLLAFMKKNERCFNSVLPKHLTQERWAWLIVNNIRQTPALAQCTPMSFINSIMLAANLGLEIRKNSCYLIPYSKECQLIVDYHGKMELARRAGVGAIHVELVRDGDEFHYGFNAEGLDFIWRPKQDVGEVIAGFSSAKINGSNQVNVMYLSEIEAIRRRVKAGAAKDWDHYGRTIKGVTLEEIRRMDVALMGFKDPYRVPWVTDWDRMARKTIIHRASNDWPMSPQLAMANELDTAHDIGERQPLAEGLAQVEFDIDPADNRPMVDGGGDTFADQKARLAEVGASELAKAAAKKGPPITKEQGNRLVTASKDAGGHDALMAALQAHGCATLDDVRQPMFDSILAKLEERP